MTGPWNHFTKNISIFIKIHQFFIFILFELWLTDHYIILHMAR